MIAERKAESARRGDQVRVLFLVDRMGYPNGQTHGGTTYFVSTLPVLARSGIELTVCFMAPRHPAAAQLEEAGVSPIFLSRSKWDPRVIFDVARIVRQRDIQVLHLASLRSLLFGRWIARALGRKALVHLHDTTPLAPCVGVLQRATARWTDAALILTDAMRPYVQREWGLKPQELEVLPSGMDTEPFRHPSPGARNRLREAWNVAPDSSVVIVPGRVRPEKGQACLIRSVPRLIEKVADVSVVIVGDGEARPYCESLVRELRLSQHVRFTGYRTDMPDVFAAADVIAIPSVGDEAFGYVALEAMAAGKPVVAFRDGGLPEVLSDGETALIVPRGDCNALADALARVLTDSNLAVQLAAAGPRRARQFTLERHVARLLKVYASLCEEPHGVNAADRPALSVRATRRAHSASMNPAN